MPVSRIRRKKASAATPDSRTPVRIGSPAWLAPAMCVFFILGLIWLVIFYIAGNDIPLMRDLGNLWNVAIGFVFIGIGFVLATRWK